MINMGEHFVIITHGLIVVTASMHSTFFSAEYSLITILRGCPGQQYLVSK
jgi:hypothetical protein